MDGQYDYVIIGGGTAGCVLANRLSADPSVRVLLLEAGGWDRNFWIHVPVGYLYTMGNKATDWMMKTVAEPGLNGRSIAYPRGKVMGGCSSINGMIYMRGQAADYDNWRQMGATGWGWDDVLPYFMRSEDHHGGESENHGSGGEWRVEQQRLHWPILDAVRDAAEEIGIPRSDDFNGGSNEGSGYFEVNQRKGRRWNAVRAFIDPVRTRSNLQIVVNAEVQKLHVADGAISKVDFKVEGQANSTTARREVILAAGAVNSPAILERSGIGNGQVLKDAGIDVVHELPGVGENLQDHLQVRMVWRLQQGDTLNQRSNSLFGKAAMAMEYALKRSGPLSMAPSQLGIFTSSGPDVEWPDIEYHVQPLSTDKLGDPLHPFPAITVSACNLRPDSRGSIHVKNPDPMQQPDIAPNYLSTVQDRLVAARSAGIARKLMSAKAVAHFGPSEILPGVENIEDDQLADRAGDIATTIFHPVGTCRMGDDDMAVTDWRLKVRGIANLRVVDASIMPKIVSGNTASPVVMIAEKAADLILEDAKVR